MQIRIRATGAVISDNDFRQLHDNISFPAVLDATTLSEFGADAVLASPAPATSYQTAVAGPVVQDALGNWVQSWIVQPWDDATIAAVKAKARADKWEDIKAKRDALSDTGGYLVAGKWFHSDTKSKIQQLGLTMMGAAVPPVPWKTMDGSFITMTQALAGGIFQAAAAQDMAIFAAAETHKAQLDAAADPLTYDFSGGWPATYPR